MKCTRETEDTVRKVVFCLLLTTLIVSVALFVDWVMIAVILIFVGSVIVLILFLGWLIGSLSFCQDE
jgi:hypothetical protein